MTPNFIHLPSGQFLNLDHIRTVVTNRDTKSVWYTRFDKESATELPDPDGTALLAFLLKNASPAPAPSGTPGKF